MVERWYKKLLVVGIIILFVGMGFTSGIGINAGQTSFPLNQGLIAWWKFDETSGNTAHDSSGHGHHFRCWDNISPIISRVRVISSSSTSQCVTIRIL